MGVFKWLRRERVTVTTRRSRTPEPTTAVEETPPKVGTIRTEEYKRDLAEFQARRSSGKKKIDEALDKKRCGRHSLPVSCTDCMADPDKKLNEGNKSATKHGKNTHRRARTATSDSKLHDGVPNIQFLFQNQVFMPGNLFTPHEARQKFNRQRHRNSKSPDMDFIQKLDFDEELVAPVYKNNSLPFDVQQFLDGSTEEVDGPKSAGRVKKSSQELSPPADVTDNCEEKMWDVMTDLNQWVDEQLQVQSPNRSNTDEVYSDASVFGLPIASSSNLDINVDKTKTWNYGKWGVMSVQIKTLLGVTIQHVKKKKNIEIEILRKCRHPNIILLMGLYPDVSKNMHLVFEKCIDTLYNLLHVQGRILSAQTSVQYASDVANALAFLNMQGFVHTELTSKCIMVTRNDTAKLADLGPCARLQIRAERVEKNYEVYALEPRYVNIEETRSSNTIDEEPLLSADRSETYIDTNAVAKSYKRYRDSEEYRWHAPELFEPDSSNFVHPCSKSDVYSLCLILWESCNAAVPWKTLTYEKLKELYIIWKTGIRLPSDGTYPGSLLSVLQQGLKLSRSERIDIATLQNTLQKVKQSLDNMEYLVISTQFKRKSNFSSTILNAQLNTDTDGQSLNQIPQRESSTDSSEKDCSKREASPLYETIRKNRHKRKSPDVKKYLSDDDSEDMLFQSKYEHIPANGFSSTCSTPIAKLKARIKDIGTPGALHRSDSTEYCSILSPNRTQNCFSEGKDNKNVEGPNTKLSRSFTPKSYKPLHIKVPDFKLDCLKSLPKDNHDGSKHSYNFDIKNYSLPATPIARSNKLRKNAWLSGEIISTEEPAKAKFSPESDYFKPSKDKDVEAEKNNVHPVTTSEDISPKSTVRDSFTGLRRTSLPQEQIVSETEFIRDCSNSSSYKSRESPPKYKVEEDVLASVNVRPLVAIHERWIYEANKKTGRSMSLPEDNRSQVPAVKPASHCIDTLQKSLPQLNIKKANIFKTYRHPSSPSIAKNGGHWEQFCQTRDTIAKSMNFNGDRFATWKKDTITRSVGSDIDIRRSEPKIDQSTDTLGIEEFIRDLIRKEFKHMLHEMSDDTLTTVSKHDDAVNRGVSNIIEHLRNGDCNESKSEQKDFKSFSRVKINGNNKPLLQITFSRSGENNLQILDNCVNVTICDGNSNGKEKVNSSFEETLVPEESQGLKRCQAFTAIQEARSTEDLYIDDDISTHMQENFGGKIKLIPLHGSLHEILCEKEDDCCLIKVKQENGCDTIYFRCDNSDTESRDAIDGCTNDNVPQETVVFKRSISLVEERIQRVIPKEKRSPNTTQKKEQPKIRPKSEVFLQNVNRESRLMSRSSPSLLTSDHNEEVEVNIENVLSYQDSSSDECLKCQADEDFEFLEREIEEDIASNMSSLNCGCLAKISEENLSVITEDN